MLYDVENENHKKWTIKIGAIFFSKEPRREIYCEHEQLKVLLFDLCTHSILFIVSEAFF